MTNPEYLNQSFLANSVSGKAWERNGFLRNLRFLVVDEIHEYRGYFGAHAALLLRRFLLRLDSVRITFSVLKGAWELFLCSATCANPKEHAELLTGQPFALESARDSLRPQRHFAFINPKKIHDFQFWEIIRLRTVRAALACLELNRSTLVFCPTVQFAEKALFDARKEAELRGLNKREISLFHAGLKSDEKQEIQESMQKGNLKIVFATNALELGIDIGGLDGVILAGFPDSIMSARQQIGRAGRNWKKDASF